MTDEALTDDELRAIVATSRDERARRAARRILNARSTAPAMPPPIGPPVIDGDELHRLLVLRVRRLTLVLGRSLTLGEAGDVVRDIYRDLQPERW